MYLGASATNHALANFQHPKLGLGNSPDQAPDYPFGLADVFTPISSGRININTADTNVLQMLPAWTPRSPQASSCNARARRRGRHGRRHALSAASASSTALSRYKRRQD